MENSELFQYYINAGVKLIEIYDSLNMHSIELIDRRIFKKSLDVELQLRNFYDILDLGEKRKIFIPIKFQLLLEENCWDRLHDNEYNYFYCSYCDLATKNYSLSEHINSAAHKINIDKTVSLYRFISHSIQIIVKQHELQRYKDYIDQKLSNSVNHMGFLNIYYTHILKDNLFNGIMLPVPNFGLINVKESQSFKNIEYWVTEQISKYSKCNLEAVYFLFSCFDCNDQFTSPIEFFKHFLSDTHNIALKDDKLSRCLIFCHACKLLFHTIRDNIELHIDSNIHVQNVVPKEICSGILENVESRKEKFEMGHVSNEQQQNVLSKAIKGNSLKVASIISINKTDDHVIWDEAIIEMRARLGKKLQDEIITMLFLEKRKIKKNINEAKFYCLACNLNFSASNLILDHYYSKKHGKQESQKNKNSIFIFCHICDSFLLTLSFGDVIDHANVNHKSYRFKNIPKEINRVYEPPIDFFNFEKQIDFQLQFKAFFGKLCCVYINTELPKNVENIDSLLLPTKNFNPYDYLNDISEWVRSHFFGLKLAHHCISYYCTICQIVTRKFQSFVAHLKLSHFKEMENQNRDHYIILCDSYTDVIGSNHDDDLKDHLYINLSSEYENLRDDSESSHANSYVNSVLRRYVDDFINLGIKEKTFNAMSKEEPQSNKTNVIKTYKNKRSLLKVVSIIIINGSKVDVTWNELCIKKGPRFLKKQLIELFLKNRAINRDIDEANFYCMACNINFSKLSFILDHYWSKNHIGQELLLVNENSKFIFCHICDSFCLTVSEDCIYDHFNADHKLIDIKVDTNSINSESTTLLTDANKTAKSKVNSIFEIHQLKYINSLLKESNCVHLYQTDTRQYSINEDTNLRFPVKHQECFYNYVFRISKWIPKQFKCKKHELKIVCSICELKFPNFIELWQHLSSREHVSIFEPDLYSAVFCHGCNRFFIALKKEEITHNCRNSKNDQNTDYKEAIKLVQEICDQGLFLTPDCHKDGTANLLIDAIENEKSRRGFKKQLKLNMENVTCMVEKFTYVYLNQSRAGTSENNPTIDGTILRFPDRKFYKISDPEEYLIRITNWIQSQFDYAKSVLKVSCFICGVNPPDIPSLWQHIVSKKHLSKLKGDLCLAVFCHGCNVFDIELQKEKIKHNCRKSKNNGNDQNTNNKESIKLIEELYTPGSYANPNSESSGSIDLENHAVRLPIYGSAVCNANISGCDVINKPKNDNDECSIFDRSASIPFAIDFSILEENIYLTKEVLNDLRETFASYNMLKGILQTDIINTLKPHYPQATVFFCGPHEIGLAKHQCTLKIFVDIGETFLYKENSNLSIIENISELFSHHSSLFSVDRSLTEGKEQKLLLKHVYTETKCQICFHSSLMKMTNLYKLYLAFDNELYRLVATVREWAMAQSILKEAVLDVQTIIWFILFFLMQPSQNIIPNVQTLMDINPKDEIIFNGWKYFLQNNSTVMKKLIENAGANYKSKSILLSNFFQYYSLLQFSSNVLCLFTGRIIRRNVFTSGRAPIELKSYSTKLKQELDFSAPLIILDPFNCNNNLASSVDQSALLQFATCCRNSYGDPLAKDS